MTMMSFECCEKVWSTLEHEECPLCGRNFFFVHHNSDSLGTGGIFFRYSEEQLEELARMEAEYEEERFRQLEQIHNEELSSIYGQL